MNKDVWQAMSNWFSEPGAYVLVDGQYGSTGKGLIAGLLAECFADRVQVVVSNAGPNSGHTSYFDDEKIVLKQLPTFSVIAAKMNKHVTTFLSAGAVVDRDLLMAESLKYGVVPIVHSHAAAISNDAKREDFENVRAIASTGQGVGPAQVQKIRRIPNAVIKIGLPVYMNLFNSACFFEIPQGFSLGINSGFYPHVTSRECSVSQALSDAQVPPSFHRKTIMTVRTFPIRVGNTENSSGPCYPDQREMSWEELGVQPELTTVTQRVRRVFTWSGRQYRDALCVLDPNVIALTFCDYLKPDYVDHFVQEYIIEPYYAALNRSPEAVLLSYGPRSSDVRVWRP